MGFINWVIERIRASKFRRRAISRSKLEPDDVTKGYRYHIDLFSDPPLEYLRRHGETCEDSESPPPRDPYGFWFPILKTWSELGITGLREIPEESKVASRIGPVLSSEYVPFMIAMREILDSPISIDAKLEKLRSLPNSSSTFQDFWALHLKFDPEFPDSVFFEKLTEVDGVSRLMAKKLYTAGIRTRSQLEDASDHELLQVRGLGRKTLEKIRDALQAEA